MTLDAGAAPQAPAVAGPAWTSRVGAWLGLGASPGALLVGAGVAERHDGPAPLLVVVAGGVLMAALLGAQGRLGLAPPYGDGGDLSAITSRYLGSRARRLVGAGLAAGMVGWLGFNAGLGGAALATLLGVPAALGPFLLGVPCFLLALGGQRRWNAVAVVATAAALALVAVVVVRLASGAVPLRVGVGPVGLAFADLSAFVGYIAVFSVRAPDFADGLRRPADLWWCVAALTVPAVLVALAGVALHLGTGSTDLIALLADQAALGNALIAVAMVGPTLTTFRSGALALEAAGWPRGRTAMVAVAVAGLALAVARFDRSLGAWLVWLAATLPPLVVPMATEAWCRRRGGTARLVPTWTWLPGSAVAVAVTAVGRPSAPLVGLAVAAVATAVWRRQPVVDSASSSVAPPPR